jgi:hypothetical protein
MHKIIKNFIFILLYFLLFWVLLILIINFLNFVIIFRNNLFFYFLLNNLNFVNIFMIILKYIYVCKIFIFDNFFDLCYQLLFFLINFVYVSFLKFVIYFKSFFFKIIYKKHLFLLTNIYKSKGYVEFFAALFFQPTLYRFFSFYIFFVLFFVSLDWIEHFFESIDNTDSEFEIDFEAAFTWDNDPLIGKNFFFLGQRLALEKTSEGPDFFKSNDFFYQSKKSKFNKYNREFLGGPEYLNVFDLFSTHETFHQVGLYEFFGPAFIVIFVSYEADFEFEFFFFNKLFSFLKIFIPKNLIKIFFNLNILLILKILFDLILYLFSYFFLLFKYIYNRYFKY